MLEMVFVTATGWLMVHEKGRGSVPEEREHESELEMMRREMMHEKAEENIFVRSVESWKCCHRRALCSTNRRMWAMGIRMSSWR